MFNEISDEEVLDKIGEFINVHLRENKPIDPMELSKIIRRNRGMIDITGVDLIKLAQEVYDLSKRVGMGLLHQDKPLEELKNDIGTSIITYDPLRTDYHVALQMDYVNG